MLPPTKAISHSPLRNATQAACSATSDDEQAVLNIRLGPLKSNQKEIRLAAMVPLPVAMYGSIGKPSSVILSRYSLKQEPMNTPVLLPRNRLITPACSALA